MDHIYMVLQDILFVYNKLWNSCLTWNLRSESVLRNLSDLT